MKNIVHHLNTSSDVQVIVKGKKTDSFPLIWERSNKGQVTLVASESFHPKKAVAYSTNNPRRSEAKVKIDIGDHLIVLIRNKKNNIRYAIFRVLGIVESVNDKGKEFTVTIRRTLLHNQAILSDSIPVVMKEFISKAIELSVDTNTETYWSLPWDTFKHPNRKDLHRQLNESLINSSFFTEENGGNTVFDFYRKLSDTIKNSNPSGYLTMTRYSVISSDKGEHVNIHTVPIHTNMTTLRGIASTVATSKDIAGITFENVAISVNVDDPMLYVYDPILTCGSTNKDELISSIINSADCIKKVNQKDGTTHYSRIIIRVFKK